MSIRGHEQCICVLRFKARPCAGWGRGSNEGAGGWGEGEGRGLRADLAVLLVVADEVAQLLLAALQRGIQLLHLAHQVRLFTL